MKNFISFVIYTDPITNRVYTHDVYPYPFPNKMVWNQFIINYSDKKLGNRFLYSEHCKIASELDLEDLQDYDFGVIKTLVDCSNLKEFYSPYNKPMLTFLYARGLSGLHLN